MTNESLLSPEFYVIRTNAELLLVITLFVSWFPEAAGRLSGKVSTISGDVWLTALCPSVPPGYQSAGGELEGPPGPQ